MRSVLAVLSVNGRRAAGRPGYVIMTVALSVAAIVAAILISSKIDVKGTIAYVTDVPAKTMVGPATVAYVPATSVQAGVSGSDGPPIMSEGAEAAAAAGALEVGVDVDKALEGHFRIERMQEAPPVSQLMRNRYDAIVIDKGGGRFDIVTVKSDAFRAQLEQALLGNLSFAVDARPGRGLGATVVGYLVMFVFMSGSAFMNFFTDDKMTGTFRRTVNAPPGVHTYLTGQLLFNGLMLFIPIMVVLVVLKEGFGADIGFSYPQYTLLMGLLSALATAFGFFMASLIENPDDGMAVSSSIIVVTSLLAGTFFIFDHEDALMRVVTKMLPQRGLMVIAEGFEQGFTLAQLAGPVGHVLAVAIALCAGGWFVCVGRLRAGRY